MNDPSRAEDEGDLRPSHVCARLLAALAASDGRRRRRKRDTEPDAIGLDVKRRLLEEAVADDPPPEAFELWLIERCGQQSAPHAPASASCGAIRAMAMDVREEWRMAQRLPGFRRWLEDGAPSEDR